MAMRPLPMMRTRGFMGPFPYRLGGGSLLLVPGRAGAFEEAGEEVPVKVTAEESVTSEPTQGASLEAPGEGEQDA